MLLFPSAARRKFLWACHRTSTSTCAFFKKMEGNEPVLVTHCVILQLSVHSVQFKHFQRHLIYNGFFLVSLLQFRRYSSGWLMCVVVWFFFCFWGQRLVMSHIRCFASASSLDVRCHRKEGIGVATVDFTSISWVPPNNLGLILTQSYGRHATAIAQWGFTSALDFSTGRSWLCSRCTHPAEWNKNLHSDLGWPQGCGLQEAEHAALLQLNPELKSEYLPSCKPVCLLHMARVNC